MGVDRSYPEETQRQHNPTGPTVESSRQEKARTPPQHMEKEHNSRNEEYKLELETAISGSTEQNWVEAGCQRPMSRAGMTGLSQFMSTNKTSQFQMIEVMTFLCQRGNADSNCK